MYLSILSTNDIAVLDRTSRSVLFFSPDLKKYDSIPLPVSSDMVQTDSPPFFQTDNPDVMYIPFTHSLFNTASRTFHTIQKDSQYPAPPPAVPSKEEKHLSNNSKPSLVSSHRPLDISVANYTSQTVYTHISFSHLEELLLILSRDGGTSNYHVSIRSRDVHYQSSLLNVSSLFIYIDSISTIHYTDSMMLIGGSAYNSTGVIKAAVWCVEIDRRHAHRLMFKTTMYYCDTVYSVGDAIHAVKHIGRLPITSTGDKGRCYVVAGGRFVAGMNVCCRQGKWSMEVVRMYEVFGCRNVRSIHIDFRSIRVFDTVSGVQIEFLGDCEVRDVENKDVRSKDVNDFIKAVCMVKVRMDSQSEKVNEKVEKTGLAQIRDILMNRRDSVPIEVPNQPVQDRSHYSSTDSLNIQLVSMSSEEVSQFQRLKPTSGSRDLTSLSLSNFIQNIRLSKTISIPSNQHVDQFRILSTLEYAGVVINDKWLFDFNTMKTVPLIIDHIRFTKDSIVVGDKELKYNAEVTRPVLHYPQYPHGMVWIYDLGYDILVVDRATDRCFVIPNFWRSYNDTVITDKMVRISKNNRYIVGVSTSMMKTEMICWTDGSDDIIKRPVSSRSRFI